jgi:hypothetical protein
MAAGGKEGDYAFDLFTRPKRIEIRALGISKILVPIP